MFYIKYRLAALQKNIDKNYVKLEISTIKNPKNKKEITIFYVNLSFIRILKKKFKKLKFFCRADSYKPSCTLSARQKKYLKK